MSPPLSFPILEEEEFCQGCLYLARVLKAGDNCSNCLGSVDVDDKPVCLRICKDFEGSDAGANGDNISTEIINEEFDEAELVVRERKPQRFSVEYHVTFSPVYRVPVLYLFVRSATLSGRLSLDQLKDLVMPEIMRSQLEEVGIMGALSYSEHPTMALPTLCLHPCNTSKAMSAIAHRDDISVEEYMLLWLGIVGHCVSLNVPMNADLENIRQSS